MSKIVRLRLGIAVLISVFSGIYFSKRHALQAYGSRVEAFLKKSGESIKTEPEPARRLVVA